MIKVENFNCNVEGNPEIIIKDYACVIKSVHKVLTESYGIDKKLAKELLKAEFKHALKTMEVAKYEEEELDE